MTLVNEGKLLHPKLQPTPPTPAISKAQLQKQRKLDKAARYSLKLDAYLSDLEDRGFTIVYVDGSSENVTGVGFVGTYGIYCEGNLAISAYLHTHLRQTNNTAEIYAALQTLKRLPTGKVAVCTNSSLMQRRPARAHAGRPVLGSHARIDRTRDTRVAEPWLPAPEDGRPGEGQRLTPGAPHNGGRHPPRGRPSATPTASNAGPQGRTLWGRCWVHTPASTAPGTHGSRNPGCPLQRTGGRGRDSA